MIVAAVFVDDSVALHVDVARDQIAEQGGRSRRQRHRPLLLQSSRRLDVAPRCYSYARCAASVRYVRAPLPPKSQLMLVCYIAAGPNYAMFFPVNPKCFCSIFLFVQYRNRLTIAGYQINTTDKYFA